MTSSPPAPFPASGSSDTVLKGHASDRSASAADSQLVLPALAVTAFAVVKMGGAQKRVLVEVVRHRRLLQGL